LKADEKSKSIVSEEKGSSVMALLKGLLIGYCITCVVFLVYSLLLTHTSVSDKYLSIVAAGTTIISVIVAGFDTARGARSRGWLWGIGAGAVYALILLLIMTIVQKGFYYDSRTVTLMVLSLAGGGLGGVLGINLKR